MHSTVRVKVVYTHTLAYIEHYLTRVGIGMSKGITLTKGIDSAMTITTVPGKGVTIDTTISVGYSPQSCSISSWQLILEII